jgi:hypothetical protein
LNVFTDQKCGRGKPFSHLNVFTGEKCGRGKPLLTLECIHRSKMWEGQAPSHT